MNIFMYRRMMVAMLNKHWVPFGRLIATMTTNRKQIWFILSFGVRLRVFFFSSTLCLYIWVHRVYKLNIKWSIVIFYALSRISNNVSRNLFQSLTIFTSLIYTVIAMALAMVLANMEMVSMEEILVYPCHLSYS